MDNDPHVMEGRARGVQYIRAVLSLVLMQMT